MHDANDPRWKIAGMTDAEMNFLAKVLKEGPKDRLLGGLVKEWDDLWKAWAEAGTFQANLEHSGVGATEADTLFKARLEPRIDRFQKNFANLMGHLKATANKR